MSRDPFVSVEESRERKSLTDQLNFVHSAYTICGFEIVYAPRRQSETLARSTEREHILAIIRAPPNSPMRPLRGETIFRLFRAIQNRRDKGQTPIALRLRPFETLCP